MQLTHDDNELIQAATDLIEERYKYSRHHVAAALRAKSGEIVVAVNVDTYLGRAAICAEAVALGRMISEGESEFTTVVAVYMPNPEFGEQAPYVASPCGVCREMLSDYCPDATVIYVENDVVTKANISDLLPGKFTKKHLPR